MMRVAAAALIVCTYASSVGAQAQPEVKALCVSAAEHGQKKRDDGRLLEAQRELLACARDACPAIVRKSCVEWLSEIEPRIPSIVVRVVDASDRDVRRAHVSLDGKPVSLDGRAIALDPGPHRIDVQIEQQPAAASHDFLAVEGESTRLVRIELHEAAPLKGASASPGLVIPAGAWIMAGVGALALSSFAYLAVSASDKHAELMRSCAPECSREETQAGRDRALAADLTLGAGIAAVAGAAVWTWLAQPATRPDTRAALLPVRGGALAVWHSRF